MNERCNRCDTKGPITYGLYGNKTTIDRFKANNIGWIWVSVSCSKCKNVHESILKRPAHNFEQYTGDDHARSF